MRLWRILTMSLTLCTNPGEVGEARLAELPGGFGGTVEQQFGKVSYAGTCNIRKHQGLYMVRVGERGPVRVFYVPGEKPGMTTRFSADGYQGELVAAGDGSLAIMGHGGRGAGADYFASGSGDCLEFLIGCRGVLHGPVLCVGQRGGERLCWLVLLSTRSMQVPVSGCRSICPARHAKRRMLVV